MLARTVIVVLAIALVAVAAGKGTRDRSPSPPPTPYKPQWPYAFSTVMGISSYNAVPYSIINASTGLFFSAEPAAEKISYSACIMLYTTNDTNAAPCDLIFDMQYGTVLIAPELGMDCCVLFPGVGPVPRDLLAPFNFTGVQIQDDFFGEPWTCNRWTSPDDFQLWTDVEHGNFIFYSDSDSGVTWQFNPWLKVGPQPASVFAVPSNCAASCPSSTIAAARKDPAVRLMAAVTGRSLE